MKTIDRLADGFPHGTPAGYRDGCRGNGACPNRGTTRMTCLEASQRYARDLRYRRAYDSGDIWLDSDIPVDVEKEKQRTSFARRSLAARGLEEHEITEKIAPKPAPPSKPLTARPVIEEALAEVEGPLQPQPEPEPEPEVAAFSPADEPSAPTVTRVEHLVELTDARAEIARLQAALAAAEEEREYAVDQVLELTIEAGRLRAAAANARQNLAELVALTRRPDATTEILRPPSISFDLVNGDLVVSMRGRMQEPDVDTLRTYLHSAS